MNLSNFRIGTKLAGVFSVLVLLAAAVGTVALSKMGVMNASMREITANSLPSVLALHELQSTTSFHRRRELQHVLSVTSEEMASTDKDLADAKSRLSKLISDYAPLVADAQEQTLYDEFKKAYGHYVAVSAQLVALSWKGAQAADEAKTFLRGPSSAAYRATEAELKKLADKNRAAAEQAAEKAESNYSSARMVVVALMAAAIALAAALAFWITRLITRPLAQAVKAAERIADGDLTVELAASGRDETAQLLQAMTAMTANLRRVVADVRSNSDGVSTAAQQIASGNLDLSARTEQQASSLQETASSMEQITGAVRQNAESAQQGNQLAQAASRVAARGGQVVEQVVGTMREINDSSRQIADIIGVIDGIAFQTNILALNAAVEAARAGEAGRGFAVVAGEVRTLAQRSADAAREIKTLIGASVERVQAGTALVDEAGSTMREVVVSIRRVEDLMGEITAASTEQSSGIGQVNEAVSQMDQVTQQNAALVEEASAAASSLREQAAQLVEAVSVFRVASEHATPKAVPTHRAPARGAADPEHRAAERAGSTVRTELKPAKAAPRPARRDADAPASANAEASWQTF